MIVVPWALSSSSRPSSAAPVAESRLPVGSSASTTGGLPAIARATATRWRALARQLRRPGIGFLLPTDA